MLLCLLLLLVVSAVHGSVPAVSSSAEFKLHDEIPVQCINEKGEWDKAPICEETGKELSFKFGVDTFQYCGLHINDENEYNRAVRRIRMQENLNCRVPFSTDKTFFVPFSIPYWGVVEPSHFHIDNHMNFVFHVSGGKIIGAAVYPVRDRFQFTKVGSVINMHGPVRWFNEHTFNSISHADSTATNHVDISVSQAVMLCAAAIVVTVVGGGLLYRFYIRPRLIRSLLKSD